MGADAIRGTLKRKRTALELGETCVWSPREKKKRGHVGQEKKVPAIGKGEVKKPSALVGRGKLPMKKKKEDKQFRGTLSPAK